MNISIVAGLAFLFQVSSEPVSTEKVAVISIERCLGADSNQGRIDITDDVIAWSAKNKANANKE